MSDLPKSPVGDEPEHVPWLTFGEAWDIQHSVGPSLDHDPKCSSVPGWHPLSGPGILCDCGAVEREWKRRTASPEPAPYEPPAERPTPITEARAFVANGSEEEKVVPLYVAQDLERQLADAREIIDAAKRPTPITDYQHLLGELAEARRQLAEAREGIRVEREHVISLIEQRDALASKFTKLDKPKYSGDPMMDSVLATPNPEFRAWVDSLPATYWTRYDLSAARIGWEAAKGGLR